MVQSIGPQTPGTRSTGAIGDRIATGGSFAPIIAILPRQMSSNLVQSLAGQTTAARLISLSAGGLAQIDVRGTPMEVRLKNVPAGQNPGDTVLINFRTEDMPDDPGALTIRGGAVDRSALTRNTEALKSDALLSGKPAEGNLPLSSEQRLSDTGRLLGSLSRIEQASSGPFTIGLVPGAATDDLSAADTPVPLSRTLNSDASASSSTAAGSTAGDVQATDQAIARYAAQTLRDIVKSIETSGLFYESHLQQWSEGDRSENELRQEPQSSWGSEDMLSDGRVPDAGQPRESARMVAAQLGHLERPAIHMTLPGYFNDRVELEIEPEQRRPRDSKQIPAWFATLKMDLPHLGPLEMRVTLLDSQCNVFVKTSAESRGVVNAGFAELMDAMSAAGLKLTAQASAADPREENNGKP